MTKEQLTSSLRKVIMKSTLECVDGDTTDEFYISIRDQVNECNPDDLGRLIAINWEENDAQTAIYDLLEVIGVELTTKDRKHIDCCS